MNYIGAREGVPVPTKPYERAGRATWVVCGCGHKGRPGGFHVCIDLSSADPEEPKQPAPSRVLAAHRLKEGTRMYAGGLSMHEVAAALGMSYSGVQKMLAQAGVERRPQGRTKRGAA